MNPKPTREAVEEMLNDFEAHELIGSRRDVYELVVSVLKDWLAQGEELEGVKGELDAERIVLNHHSQMIDQLKEKGEQLCCRVGVLEMENQELKTSMEAEYIERQAKHIQVLVKEREALKEKVEWFKNECGKDISVIDELRAEKRKLEAYITEKEGYQP